MRWEAAAAPDVMQDLILFDGDCVLCSRAAHFVHRRDPAQRFKFVAIQSEYGRALAARFGVNADAPETNAAIIAGIAYFKADAALEVLACLPGGGWARLAKLAPRTVRNWIYDRIARNRYRWFGRRESCWVDDAALKQRIVERAP
ncbi:MAG TPA: DCC1-like thiol-disulfide oxidoreductase family protein [Terricaulis sp.]|nr:DCC1-like thiol-disulfide oxidoreductase family protein [Terricaulis sp.]HRP12262.1 DCC1-like thiol-disulfide oxidoreductase family protein [Terricaulis sp.]